MVPLFGCLLCRWFWLYFFSVPCVVGLRGSESLDLTQWNEDMAKLAVYSDIATLYGATDALS
jgi:hypothetical protein